MLKSVNLTVWPGEVHAFMGENGAGKSTLMKILAGAYRPDAGEILLDGKPVHLRTPQEARAAGIGIIYQELTVAPNLTVSGNVFLGSELKRRLGFMTDTAEMERKTQEVLNGWAPGSKPRSARHTWQWPNSSRSRSRGRSSTRAECS